MRHDRAPLGEELAEQRAVAREHARHLRRVVALELARSRAGPPRSGGSPAPRRRRQRRAARAARCRSASPRRTSARSLSDRARASRRIVAASLSLVRFGSGSALGRTAWLRAGVVGALAASSGRRARTREGHRDLDDERQLAIAAPRLSRSSEERSAAMVITIPATRHPAAIPQPASHGDAGRPSRRRQAPQARRRLRRRAHHVGDGHPHASAAACGLAAGCAAPAGRSAPAAASSRALDALAPARADSRGALRHHRREALARHRPRTA